MILGYIVTERKLTNIDGFVEQVNDISLADSTKPILIVGWKKAKEDPRYTSILLSETVISSPELQLGKVAPEDKEGHKP